MEEEKVVDHIQPKSRSPLPTGIPINWGLITGPVPQPVFPASSLSAQLPPPQSSAVHALQTKVKSLTQRRARGRDREKERERPDAEALVSSPAGQISSEVLLRQRPRGKAQLSPPAPSWRSGTSKTFSSSDEEEEVEVQVSFEIHSPPAAARGEQVLREGEEAGDERAERNEDQGRLWSCQPCGLGGGASLESLLSDHSSSSKDDPSPPPPPAALPPLPALSSLPASPKASASSSTATRRWAPPKGFWRVVRPESLLLNGVTPDHTPCPLPPKEHAQTEAPTEQEAQPGAGSDAAGAVDDSDTASEFRHSDSVECYLDRCEQKESDAAHLAKELCSSDSSESASSEGGRLSADERSKVKRRAYVKLRERTHNFTEESEQSGGERAGCSGDTGEDGKGKVS
ncbi:hypothetical protein EYF80_049483 [Liparis tanakae]|uniref:Uncharacterized protein n=1 Tax=Liparis tanakae TaxID=230148 RepID=A0A4Z2FGL6_9TELE|nr:hypothetical protein EYF80_049483 [Liparis tanakae]